MPKLRLDCQWKWWLWALSFTLLIIIDLVTCQKVENPGQAQAGSKPPSDQQKIVEEPDLNDDENSLIDWATLTTGSKIELITAVVIPSVIGLAVIIEVLMRQNPQNVPAS